MISLSEGVRLFPGALDRPAQQALAEAVMAALTIAPATRYATRGGRPMSVAMSGLGPLSWVSDRGGYRYQDHHPGTGQPWPEMPPVLLDLWRQHGDPGVPPDACLVNLYGPEARMGLHQDRDEADFAFPVLSVSLGDTALFRLGGARRTDPTRQFRLASGDLLVLSGAGRLAFHGVDRILAGSSSLLPGGGRINLTLRRARPAPP